MRSRTIPTGCVALFLAGCGLNGLPDVARLNEAEPATTSTSRPPDADPNACYGQDSTPAVIETVTEQVMLQPAQVSTDGQVTYPAIYKTETRQVIIQERREQWFETPCYPDMTPDFVATLQRALNARGHYQGPINGEMTPRTRRAIRAYQKQQGLDSAILSKAAARQLGLVSFGSGFEG